MSPEPKERAKKVYHEAGRGTSALRVLSLFVQVATTVISGCIVSEVPSDSSGSVTQEPRSGGGWAHDLG